MLVPLNQWIPWKTLTFHARSRRERDVYPRFVCQIDDRAVTLV